MSCDHNLQQALREIVAIHRGLTTQQLERVFQQGKSSFSQYLAGRRYGIDRDPEWQTRLAAMKPSARNKKLRAKLLS